MAKFAFNPDPNDHIMEVTHEDGLAHAVGIHRDPAKAYEDAHRQLTDNYKSETIGSREAKELIRFDSKMGTLKWKMHHPATCSKDCKTRWD